MRMRLPALLVVVSVALVLAKPGGGALDADQADGLIQLEWLAGCWIGEGGEECWLAPLDGTMVGMNRGPRREDRRPMFEFLRIVEDEQGVVYLASPAGRNPPTPFRAVEIDAERVVFANPAHDFPQRITYWLDTSFCESVLRARVEAKAESGEWQGFELAWTKANP